MLGRVLLRTNQLMEEVGQAAVNLDFWLNQYELKNYAVLAEWNEDEFEENEIACFRSGLRGGFENKSDTHVMKYE